MIFFFSKLRFFCAWFCKGWTWSCGLTSTRTRGFGPCTETRSEPPGPKLDWFFSFAFAVREEKIKLCGFFLCGCVFLGAQREQGAALREPKSSGPHHHGLSCEYFQKAPRHRLRFFTFFGLFFFHPRSRIDGGVRAKQRQVLFSGRPLRPPRALYQLFALVSSVSDVARCPPLPSPPSPAASPPPPDHRRVSHRSATALARPRLQMSRRARGARARLSALTNWVLITAAAPLQGCREKTDTFNPDPKDWSAFRSRDYGYTRMQVVNASHLYLEQVSDDQVGNSLLRFLRAKWR